MTTTYPIRKSQRSLLVALAATLTACIGAVGVSVQPSLSRRPALQTLDASSLARLRDAFNSGAGHKRLIAFLSPT